MFDELMEKVSSSLKRGMNISLVFGEAIETQGKTIIPVSKVMGGFGGGEGSAPGSQNSDEENKEIKAAHGIGGGGGLSNEALGIFEIGPDNTRFIPVVKFKHIIILLAMLLGFFRFLLRTNKRKKK